MRKVKKKTARKTKTKSTPTRKKAKSWTSAEVTKLKKAYRFKTASEIAKSLRRSLSSVKAKARSLGLKKATPKKKTTKKASPRKTSTRRKTRRRR